MSDDRLPPSPPLHTHNAIDFSGGGQNSGSFSRNRSGVGRHAPGLSRRWGRAIQTGVAVGGRKAAGEGTCRRKCVQEMANRTHRRCKGWPRRGLGGWRHADGLGTNAPGCTGAHPGPPPSPAQPRQKHNREYIAAARELAPLLEQVNAAGPALAALGKYDVGRRLNAPAAVVDPRLRCLPAA
jgi:hypothetical protein